ncbi:hypothetical protein RUND412_000551 [Rhizina undulata]
MCLLTTTIDSFDHRASNPTFPFFYNAYPTHGASTKYAAPPAPATSLERHICSLDPEDTHVRMLAETVTSPYLQCLCDSWGLLAEGSGKEEVTPRLPGENDGLETPGAKRKAP